MLEKGSWKFVFMGVVNVIFRSNFVAIKLTKSITAK